MKTADELLTQVNAFLDALPYERTPKSLYEPIRYVLSMGGDGTFLQSAVRVGEKQIPLVGINMGRLGFLADVLPDEVEEALDAVRTWRFVPGTRDGVPDSMWTRVPVTFLLK